MINVKSWYQSKTVWAVLVGIALAILTLARTNPDDVTTWLTMIGEVVAGVAAIISRIRAKTQIAKSPGASVLLLLLCLLLAGCAIRKSADGSFSMRLAAPDRVEAKILGQEILWVDTPTVHPSTRPAP